MNKLLVLTQSADIVTKESFLDNIINFVKDNPALTGVAVAVVVIAVVLTLVIIEVSKKQNKKKSKK